MHVYDFFAFISPFSFVFMVPAFLLVILVTYICLRGFIFISKASVLKLGLAGIVIASSFMVALYVFMIFSSVEVTICEWKLLHSLGFCSQDRKDTTLYQKMVGSNSEALGTFALNTATARTPAHDLQQVYIDIDELVVTINIMEIDGKVELNERFAAVRKLSNIAGGSMTRFGIKLEHVVRR